jgi:hypothetical protein
MRTLTEWKKTAVSGSGRRKLVFVKKTLPLAPAGQVLIYIINGRKRSGKKIGGSRKKWKKGV